MINFIYKNKEYKMIDDLWNKYSLMHPIRTLDSLLSTLRVCYPDNLPTIEEIEQLILEEYNLHLNIDDVVEKARTQYDKSI